MKIYTRKGDDGTTGLLFGGRVRKDTDAPMAYGVVDEAQALIGVARAEAEPGGRLDGILIGVCRDLYVCMAELATLPANRSKLVAGTTSSTRYRPWSTAWSPSSTRSPGTTRPWRTS